jgi:hypothetical protein
VINRNFSFDDAKWYIDYKYDAPFLKVNTPIMGSIYVLRALYNDGTYAQGDLLQKNRLPNRLHPLQKIIKDYLLSNALIISFEELLPLLAKRFELIYINDFGCRGRSKTGFTKLPQLNRQLSNTIYQKESRPFLERLPSLPLREAIPLASSLSVSSSSASSSSVSVPIDFVTGPRASDKGKKQKRVSRRHHKKRYRISK